MAGIHEGRSGNAPALAARRRRSHQPMKREAYAPETGSASRTFRLATAGTLAKGRNPVCPPTRTPRALSPIATTLGTNELSSRMRSNTGMGFSFIASASSLLNSAGSVTRSICLLSPNVASQWRRGKGGRNWTEAESRRPLHSPGYAASSSRLLLGRLSKARMSQINHVAIPYEVPRLLASRPNLKYRSRDPENASAGQRRQMNAKSMIRHMSRLV
jgi:hypothetical protein